MATKILLNQNCFYSDTDAAAGAAAASAAASVVTTTRMVAKPKGNFGMLQLEILNEIGRQFVSGLSDSTDIPVGGRPQRAWTKSKL